MNRDKKIHWLWRLQRLGIIYESVPVGNGCGGTAFWRFFVVAEAWLPDLFKDEYRQLGELRW